MADHPMPLASSSSSEPTPLPASVLKPCDTLPPPQNLALRLGTKQLEGLKLQYSHHEPSSSSSGPSLLSPPTDASVIGSDSIRLSISDSAIGDSGFSVIAGETSATGTSNENDRISNDHDAPNAFILSSAAAGKKATPVSPPRHLCMRHRRTADESINYKLGQSLNALPLNERQMINTLWSMFSSSQHTNRTIILQGILTMCCSSQLSLLAEQVPQLLRIDPFFVFPRELSLRVLKYLDATSLARAAQVSRSWRSLADDDILWRNMCEQHIEKKCATCGWGLPLLEKKRRRSLYRPRPSLGGVAANHSSSALLTLAANSSSASSSAAVSRAQTPGTGHGAHGAAGSTTSASVGNLLKRRSPFDDEEESPESAAASLDDRSRAEMKRRKTTDAAYVLASSSSQPLYHPSHLQQPTPASSPSSPDLNAEQFQSPAPSALTLPWKDVYSERLKIERNWRRGRYSVTTLKGHTDGVMCLQLNETLSHPSFPVLISGSYDRTVRVWNMETGQTIRVMTGHTRAVRALQFDEVKLITGSMDHTLRVWNWRTGQCVRVLEGHSEGVVSLTFDADVLASGSVDTTVKVWNLKKGDCFTLRGHEDWVNAVKIWDPNAGSHGHSSSNRPQAKRAPPTTSSSATTSASTSPSSIERDLLAPSSSSSAHVVRASSPLDPATSASDLAGKMLFSASDDCTIRLWDLCSRSCVRVFKGHVGQVQSIMMIMSDEESERVRRRRAGIVEAARERQDGGALGLMTSSSSSSSSGAAPLSPSSYLTAHQDAYTHSTSTHSAPRPLLISGSLDNTLKLWDVESGADLQTYFGHIEGVWAVASDKLRLVSASHDRTIKVWDRENDKSSHTLVGHRGAVTCLDLVDDKIVSGSDDGDIRVWSFAPAPVV